MKNANLLLPLAIFVVFHLNFQHLKAQVDKKTANNGYASVTYSALVDNQFMKNWLVLGPVKVNKAIAEPSDSIQKMAFEKDLLTNVVVNPKQPLPAVKLNDSVYNWKAAQFEDGIIDLDKMFKNADYSYAYALAEINLSKPERLLV